jgi:hypothetical protein
MTTFTWAPPRAAGDAKVKYHYDNFCRLCVYILTLALPSLPFFRYEPLLSCTHSPSQPAQSLGRPLPPTLPLSRAGRLSVYCTLPIALCAIFKVNHDSITCKVAPQNTSWTILTLSQQARHTRVLRPTNTRSQHISLCPPPHS